MSHRKKKNPPVVGVGNLSKLKVARFSVKRVNLATPVVH